MASNQPGPYIPSESIASQLEKPKDQPKALKKEHIDAQPGLVILSEEQAGKVDPPISKEELKKKAQEMNQWGMDSSDSDGWNLKLRGKGEGICFGWAFRS